MDQRFQDAIKIIRSAAEDAGLNPGVYKMINEKGKIIYIGKAKHLKNRLISYSRIEKMPIRLKMMVSNIFKIEFIVTNSEVEAFLLEDSLIKQVKPFYNILLKDDKTFPYIVVGTGDFPRVFKHRTKSQPSENFFGPYPASNSLDETLKIIQKAFLVRNCTDSYFSNRSRPCLQYFIKRCSAPCVKKISKESYQANIELAKKLLTGDDEIVRESLVFEMREASKNLDFEKAAIIRDRIKSITEIQSKQYIQIPELRSIDFVSIVSGNENAVVFVSFFRAGKNVGSDNFVLDIPLEAEDDSEILESFLIQFYSAVFIPSAIITNIKLKNKESIVDFISKRYSKKVQIQQGTSGPYKKIILSCEANAKIKLYKESNSEYEKQLQELSKMIKKSKINRIETYDNSHIQGTNACGVMIVFEDGKLQKSKVRKFNISEMVANSGDDLSMMKFVLQKRFKSESIPEKPDLLLIDGGKTQISAVNQILEKQNINCDIIGIAKQNFRTVGDEKLVFKDGREIVLGNDSPLLNFLIMLRNEAHRSAITFHRKKRNKALSKSEIDAIPSIGTVRKKKLLEHFGSVENIKKASIDDLKMVKGISSSYAVRIFDFFNKGGK